MQEQTIRSNVQKEKAELFQQQVISKMSWENERNTLKA